MKHWLIDICPIQSYEIQLFPINNTNEIPSHHYLSSKDLIHIDHLHSNQDYQLNLHIYSEAGETFERLTFRTITEMKIFNQQMIFILIGIGLFLLILVLILIILRKTSAERKEVNVRNLEGKHRLKPILSSNKPSRSLQKTKNRADSFPSGISILQSLTKC